MLQLTTRSTATLVGITAAVVVTNKYYAQAVECMARLEKLAHAAIPAILSVLLVYHVIRNSMGKTK